MKSLHSPATANPVGSHKRGRRYIALASILCVASISACSAGKAARAGGSSDTLTVGQTQNVTDFDPYSLKLYSYNLQNQLFNVPVRLDAKLKPQPELASSWDLSKDGKTLTLHLRKDVKFHNGDPMTSADVQYSLKYVQDPSHAANILALAKLIKSVETPDPQTVVLHYADPNPAAFDFLNLLYITDHAHPDSIKTDANGTGPYTLKKFNPGQDVQFVATKDYWGPAPGFKSIDLKILPDESTEVAQLKSGDIDLVTRLTPQDYASLKSNSNLTTGVAAKGMSYVSFDINVTKPPLSNPDVRQALSLALDRKRIATEVVGEGSSPGCLPYPETSLAYFKDQASQCKFDLDAAKALLQKAGVPNLSFTIQTSTAVNPEITQMAQIFQADLKKIGVDAKIQDMDSATYNSDRAASKFEVEAHGYGRAGGDPATMFGTAHSWTPHKNPQKFDDPQYDKLLVEASSTTDDNARKQLYRQINDIILKQNFVLVGAENEIPWASTNKLTGIAFSQDGLVILGGAKK